MNQTKEQYKNQKSILFKSFLFLFLFQGILLNAQELVKSEGVFDFETETIDYGTISQNSDGVRIFNFTNRGQSPIVIVNVKSSCGCTIPNYSKKPVMPGESSKIEVKYDTKRLGAFSKTITITSNAFENKKQLKIKGNVKKEEKSVLYN